MGPQMVEETDLRVESSATIWAGDGSQCLWKQGFDLSLLSTLYSFTFSLYPMAAGTTMDNGLP